MNTETYTLIIVLITAAFMAVTTVALYIVNQARKDANSSVPPEVAKTLADALPPDVLKLLIILANVGTELAKNTDATADDELMTTIRRELTPTPHTTLPLDPNAEG
jgi:cellobiose-specific phosphotransferase system component IIC